MKKENVKKFFAGFKPIIRGLVKSLPFGTMIIEATDNVKTEIALSKNETPKRAKFNLNGSEKPSLSVPHSWGSIIFQLIFAAIIVYAFVSGKITIEQILQYFTMFESQTSDSINILNDTIQ